MADILNPEALIALVTLTVLEIVLGIDNIVFISIMAGKLPVDQQGKARSIGLGVCAGHARPAAAVTVLGRPPDRSALHRRWARRSPVAT